MKYDLEACPFCGGRAELQPTVQTSFVAWVRCIQCGAESGAYSSNEAAVKAWNQRMYFPLIRAEEKIT